MTLGNNHNAMISSGLYFFLLSRLLQRGSAQQQEPDSGMKRPAEKDPKPQERPEHRVWWVGTAGVPLPANFLVLSIKMS